MRNYLTKKEQSLRKRCRISFRHLQYSALMCCNCCLYVKESSQFPSFWWWRRPADTGVALILHPYANPFSSRLIHIDNKRPHLTAGPLLSGGDGGSRTRVQEHFRKIFSERIRVFGFAEVHVTRQTYTRLSCKVLVATRSSRQGVLHK